jgi:hypothetical protein
MSRTRLMRGALLVAACLFFVPFSAAAQSSIAGVVRDPSGAVLPGVSIEATSPVLIEKVRTAVTDGSGQYRLAELTPGTYTVAFTLSGFATVRREGVEVSGGGAVISINIDMRVGGLQETITVSGETPVVDVQVSTRKQTVLDDAVISALPASRGYGNLLTAVPGVQNNSLDNGANPTMVFFTAHGGRGNEGTVQIDGMNVGSAFNGGGVASFGYDTMNAAEIQVTVTGGLGEVDRGGPAFNMVPKTGGNTFSGTAFYSTAGEWSQGSNLDDTLRSYGFGEVPGLIKNWDASYSMGGPIKRDRLWFFGQVRTFGSHTVVPGQYGNKNAGDPNAWSYVEDRSLKVRNANDKKIGAIRLTNQLTPRHKVGFYFDYQHNCTGSAYEKGAKQCRDRGDDWIALNGGFNAGSPESGNVWDDREKIVQGSWSSPLTDKLLLEAGVSSFNSRWGGQEPGGALMDFIPVIELVPNPGVGTPLPFYAYRAPWSFFGNIADIDQQHNVWRASASYVTGAHNVKIGYQAAYQIEKQHHYSVNSGIQNYLFFAGFPISLTQRISPHMHSNRTRFDAFYVQDQWTKGRMTLQGALRYEHAWSWFPEGENGITAASRYNASPILFPDTVGVKGFHDITPRMGLAYDVFGNGKTSFKTSFSKYLQPANNESVFIIGNNAVTFAQTTDRSWFDADGDYVADCDLNNPGTSGECGPWANGNFGKASSGTAVNPAVLEGWGSRPFDWQMSASVQQEVMPRVSATFGYNRRSWGNFYYTDNRAVGPADYDRVTLTAPRHDELPDGGGYPVSFWVLKENRFGAVDNYFTFAKDYGDVTYYWHGFDYDVNARMANGLVIQGGATTGRGIRDTCEVEAALPEATTGGGFGAAQRQIGACAVTENWQTNLRGLVSYTLPKADVQLSAIWRSVANTVPQTDQNAVATNGLSLNANYDVTAAQVQSAIGRPLPGGAATQSVNLALPGQVFGPRITTVDLRVTKLLRFGRTRTAVGLDLYNLFNDNTGTTFNQAFGTDGLTWLRPTAVMSPRFVRFNVTMDF